MHKLGKYIIFGNFYFLFIGSEDEHGYVQHIIDMTSFPERCRNIAGLLTIPELGALLQQCDVVVSNDSGPLHLAAAMGAHTVALFGPESPTFYGPLSKRATVVYTPVSCSPCMNVYAAKSFECHNNARCMHAVEVAEVELAVQQVYSTA